MYLPAVGLWQTRHFSWFSFSLSSLSEGGRGREARYLSSTPQFLSRVIQQPGHAEKVSVLAEVTRQAQDLRHVMVVCEDSETESDRNSWQQPHTCRDVRGC